MAFSVSTPSNLGDALSNLHNFYSTDMGWGAVLSGGVLEVQVPGRSQVFRLSYVENFQAGNNSSRGRMIYDYLTCEVPNISDPLRTSCNYLTPLTRMTVHGGVSPEPWSLVSFETAPGYFQHLFFGFAEKMGEYEGGALISSTNWPTEHTGASNFNSWGYSATSNLEWGMLFNGAFNRASDVTGGLEIISPEAPRTSYRFYTPSSAPYYSIGGGFGDAYNGLLAYTEFSGVDGSLNAHPIVLFAQINGDQWETPVACVPGVRMINIDAFDPGEVVSIGGEQWQVFPLCNKWLPYGTSPGMGVGPGTFTPGSSTTLYYNMGGSTERWGVAVKRE